MAARKRNIQLEMIKHMQQPHQLPNQQPDSPQVIRRRVEKKLKRNFYTLKMLLALCGVGVFCVLFVQLYMDAQINHVHYQIQQVQNDINREMIYNEQLNAIISELSQHSRIMGIAEERGLTFTENVITIER